MKPRSNARHDLIALATAAVCAAAIGFVQPSLAASVKKIKVMDDVTALPAPEQLRIMTFGYRAAVANILWAQLLVEHGIRFQEKRPFPGQTRYLDGILALEPNHRTLFTFVDTLLVYKPGEQGTRDDALLARAYLERGTRERPYDHEIWLHYGQFVAFLGPSFLTDEDEIQRWRKDGAIGLAHAIELGSNPDRSLSAATLLSKAGERDAAIQQLQRAYALTDSADMRQQIGFKLAALGTTAAAESTVAYFEHEWRTRYPFLSREAALLVGPYRSPSRCAGAASGVSARCASSWAGVARDR